MRVYFHTGNHNNHWGISDTVLFVKNALQDIGYAACVSHNIVAGEVNILMENFKPEHVQDIANKFHSGSRYIMIATEPVINGTFNGGIEGTHWHYSNTDYWKGRFEAFNQIAPFASAIWVLAESMVAGYQALFPELPVRFLPHGYVNNFATVNQREDRDRDIDFFFSGTLTDHRRAILLKLFERYKTVHVDQSAGAYLREDYLSRSKICLSLRLSPHNQIPSVSRMHYLLQNGSFVLQEAYALPCPLDPYVMHVPSTDVANWAVAALDLTNRREIAAAAHARFKADMPMSRILPPLLDEALARSAAPLGRGPLPAKRFAVPA
jgi:hypothetical protein